MFETFPRKIESVFPTNPTLTIDFHYVFAQTFPFQVAFATFDPQPDGGFTLSTEVSEIGIEILT